MVARVTAQDSSGVVPTVTFPGTPGLGNTMCIDIYVNLGTGSVSLPAGWVLKKESACGSSAANGSVGTWEKVAGAAEPSTVLMTTAASVTRWLCSEYSGVPTSSADDGTGTASGGTGSSSVSSHATGGLTTTNPDDLIRAVFGFAAAITIGSVSVDSGFSVLPQSQNRIVAVERIVSAIGSYNPTLSWTPAQRAGGIITALKADSGGRFLPFFAGAG